jgi:ribonuclease P protein component
MAGPYYPGAAHAAAGSSQSATSGPFACASANSARFPKSARLLKRASFEKIHASGTKSGCAYFSVICLHDESFAPAKAGLTAPRRLGSAVVRNRLKRRMREAIRHEIWRVAGGWGFVFHPRSAAADAPMERLRAEVEKVFRRCN